MIHGEEVDALPPGITLLASNAVTRVQVAEITFDWGAFWGCSTIRAVTTSRNRVSIEGNCGFVPRSADLAVAPRVTGNRFQEAASRPGQRYE